MIILSTVCYGISSALIRVYGKDENPVFGANLSALILKESGQSFGIKEVIALVLISGGIFIVQKGGGKTD